MSSMTRQHHETSVLLPAAIATAPFALVVLGRILTLLKRGPRV